MLDASTIPNTQQQNNLEDGSFFMHFQWIICVPFQNNFWKAIQWVSSLEQSVFVQLFLSQMTEIQLVVLLVTVGNM